MNSCEKCNGTGKILLDPNLSFTRKCISCKGTGKIISKETVRHYVVTFESGQTVLVMNAYIEEDAKRIAEAIMIKSRSVDEIKSVEGYVEFSETPETNYCDYIWLH